MPPPLVLSRLLPLRLVLVRVPRRFVGNRQRLYGEEEGHGPKNEVRKLKWQRKHLIRATGGRFRHQQGLPPDPFTSYGLVSRCSRLLVGNRLVNGVKK